MTTAESFLKKNERAITTVAVICLTVLAGLIRAPGLGKWGLNTDEYYFSRAVSFLLEKGVPEFPGGGYYARGILLQYLTTIPIFLFKDFEFAVRFIPLIFGVLTVPLFYLFCRKYLPVLPAIACAAMLLLSSWHIEFSRFARMYSVFQFLFFAFLYFCYSGYWQKNRRYQVICWGLAFLSIFFYEASIFMPLILLLTLCGEEAPFSRQGIKVFVVVGILLLVNYLLVGIDYRHWGVKNFLPPEDMLGEHKKVIAAGFIFLPWLELLPLVWHSYVSAIGYLLLLGGAILVVWRQKQARSGFGTIVLAAVSALLPLLHQFGLLAWLLIIFFLCREDLLGFLTKNKRLWGGYFLAALLFWGLVGFGYIDSLYTWFPDASLLRKSVNILANMFHYPRLNYAVLKPFAKCAPGWTVFASLTVVIAVVRNLWNRQATARNFPLIVTLLCLFFVPLFKTPGPTTRYSFFFFPLILLVACMEALDLFQFIKHKLKNRAAITCFRTLIFLPLVIFSFSEDFNLHHVLNVASRETTFRTGKYADLAYLWYPRYDFRGAASFVNRVVAEGDVLVIDEVPTSFYLEKPFIAFVPYQLGRFKRIARKLGRVECWTGRPLIYRPGALAGLLPADRHKSLWLVVKTRAEYLCIENPAELVGINQGNAVRMFQGMGGKIEVWRYKRV